MKNFKKSIAFIGCFLCLFSLISVLLINKQDTDTTGFYQQRKNSVDVLYIGSSHIYHSISPIRIYEEYGVTGYIRATSCQRSWESYTLLEEALKYQKPKVVVYEVMAAFHDKPQRETFSREIYDTMRPSLTKMRGIIADLDKEEGVDLLSMCVPMVRYHERWKSLNKDDFTYLFEKDLLPYKGYMLTYVTDAAVDYDKHMYEADMEPVALSDKSEQYVRKMKTLCDENNIEFVMVKMPTVYAPYWNVGMSRGISLLAEDMGVPFIDYNIGKDAVDINWNTETCDQGNHLNHYGAEKVTDVFADWLIGEYDLPDHRGDKQYDDWNRNVAQYEMEIAKSKLTDCSEYLEYMDLVASHFAPNDDFVVMITAKANMLSGMNEEHLTRLQELGDDLNYVSTERTEPNIFIRRGNSVIAKLQTAETIAESYFIDGHRFDITCLANDTEEACDIYVDGQAIGMNAIGMDIVIYDLKESKCFDSCYAIFDKEGILRIYRK